MKTMRAAIVLATFVHAMAATACEDRGPLTGPTAITPMSPNGGVPIPAAEVGRFSGEFTVTLTADVACDSLPAELRTRTYGATWTLNPYWHAAATYYDIGISGPAFLEGFNSSERFYVGVTDDDASFGLGSLQGQPAFVEQLSATAYFAIGGSAEAALSPSASSFAASMDGYVEVLRHEITGGCSSGGPFVRLRAGQSPHSSSMRVEQASAELGPSMRKRSMNNTTRAVIVHALLLHGLAAVACEDRGSVTGPTAMVPVGEYLPTSRSVASSTTLRIDCSAASGSR